MRGLIETSFYLLLLTFISYICIDYVAMNMSVSKYSEVQRYVHDYVSVYGKCENGQLNDTVLDEIGRIEEQTGMRISCEHITDTSKNSYYRLSFTYSVCSRLLNVEKTHTTVRYAGVDTV